MTRAKGQGRKAKPPTRKRMGFALPFRHCEILLRWAGQLDVPQVRVVEEALEDFEKKMLENPPW